MVHWFVWNVSKINPYRFTQALLYFFGWRRKTKCFFSMLSFDLSSSPDIFPFRHFLSFSGHWFPALLPAYHKCLYCFRARTPSRGVWNSYELSYPMHRQSRRMVWDTSSLSAIIVHFVIGLPNIYCC